MKNLGAEKARSTGSEAGYTLTSPLTQWPHWKEKGTHCDTMQTGPDKGRRWIMYGRECG